MNKIRGTGELAEWLKAPSWKGGEVKASVSSNLMFSAIFKNTPKIRAFFNKYLNRCSVPKCSYDTTSDNSIAVS